MFPNHPIQLEILVNNEEELIEKLAQLKVLHQNGITQSHLSNIVTNLHNGQGLTPKTWNSKTLKEWGNFLLPHLNGQNITEIQLELVFNYLRRYHNGVIRQNVNKYEMTVKQLFYDNRFLFEYVGLTILDL